MKGNMRILLGVFLSCLCLGSCGKEEATSIRYDYDLDRYIEVGAYENLQVEFDDPTLCTEDEIDHAQMQVLLSYANFEEKESEDAVVELYNKVVIHYSMYLDGKELEDYTEKSYQIVVGSEGFGDLDYTMGQALLGARVGEEREAEYTFPENDSNASGWEGLTVTMKGKVNAIFAHVLPELTDEFVATLEVEGDSFITVEDFREGLKASLLEQKEAAKAHAVFTAYMDSVKVKKYPKKEVNSYVEQLWQEAQAGAEQMGLEMEQYLASYLSTDEKSFRAELEETAKERVKDDMACIQLSRLRGTTLSEEESQKGIGRLFEETAEDGTFATIEEFEAYYTENELRESLLWEKSFQALVEEAVSKSS